MIKKVFILILILSAIFILSNIYFSNSSKTIRITTDKITSTPTPYHFPYTNPVIPKNQSYRIAIAGDSIVSALGPNANTLREDLIKYYPNSEFVTYNYGYPSTNVLSLYNRLTQNSSNGDIAILNQGVEFIIIESFGYNPLSEFPLEEGLKKQTEELEKCVQAILREKPNTALAFLTPIALDPINFARTTRKLSPEVRKTWVAERVAYINNHRLFAQSKGIPVIDVYNLSLKANGEVDRKYIAADFIHPSEKGIALISKTIADYIYNNKIFPE